MKLRNLFNQGSSHLLKQNIEKQLHIDLQEFAESQVLQSNIGEWVNHFQEKYAQTVPMLLLKKKTVERLNDPKTKALIIAYHVPFTGNESLFQIQPAQSRNLFYSTDFIIEDQRFSIHISADSPFVRSGKPDTFNKHFDDFIEVIQHNLENLRNDLVPLNSIIERTVRQFCEKEKQRIIDEQRLVEDLGIPLVRRDDAPEIVPVQRKILIPTIKVEESNDAVKQQLLEIAQYDSILETIQYMALVLERSPHAFSQMKEEDLRWLLLVGLNGQYEIRGQATGETFNYSGKTDILVRINGENVFVAECKMWHGKQELLKALNQLLGYVTWRDTKTAIIIFNRKTNISTVLNQIPEIVSSHENYRATIEWGSEEQFRYKFVHRDDSNREFYLSVLVFDVPYPDEK